MGALVDVMYTTNALRDAQKCFSIFILQKIRGHGLEKGALKVQSVHMAFKHINVGTKPFELTKKTASRFVHKTPIVHITRHVMVRIRTPCPINLSTQAPLCLYMRTACCERIVEGTNSRAKTGPFTNAMGEKTIDT
jgi:hypothetical protein